MHLEDAEIPTVSDMNVGPNNSGGLVNIHSVTATSLSMKS